MSLLQVLVTIIMVKRASSQCTYSSWWYSFDTTGQSKCDGYNDYIQGFDRNNVDWNDDPISQLEGAQCCKVPSPWSSSEQLVVYADWAKPLDSENVWVHCPQGYFLQGLYRSNTGWPRWSGYLFNIENARCAKPAELPERWGECYQEDISSKFDVKGISSCSRDGYYVTGIYRSNGDDLYFLDYLKCCQLADKPDEIDEVGKVKSYIMDTTLRSMASLADMLGYGWCSGCKGVYVGENFYRSGDTWVADASPFWGSPCDGYKSDQRLNIAFRDWSFAVKEIKYGQSVVDQLQPDSIDSGTIFNKEATPVTESFERSATVEETITHSTTTGWKNSHELSISLDFSIPKVGGGSVSYKTSFEYSSSTTNEKSQKTSKTFKKTTSKTVNPFSAAKYNVIISKSRTTIPYTAVISTKFNTEFLGFLRWGEGFNSPTTNYHYTHKGTDTRPTFNYRFGDTAVPFYKALKKESDNNAVPWLWKELKKNYPSAQSLIGRLTDEKQYEFTLSGTLEQVAGTSIDIIWETVKLNRREVPGENAPIQNANGTMFATVGPNDPPAVVKYPEISPVIDQQFDLPLKLVDQKSA